MAWPTAAARTKTWGTEILTASDLQGQFDLGFTYFNDSLNGTTGHDHSGGTAEGPKISLTAAVTGTLPVANGGTGVATLSDLLNLVYPVGSIYYNAAVATNPSSLLGFGTWVAFSAGKVIIGIDTGDTDYDSLSDTGGAKTHTHTYSGTNTVGGTHNSDGGANVSAGGGINLGGGGFAVVAPQTYSGTTNSGSSMQPYVTAYAWKRTV